MLHNSNIFCLHVFSYPDVDRVSLQEKSRVKLQVPLGMTTKILNLLPPKKQRFTVDIPCAWPKPWREVQGGPPAALLVPGNLLDERTLIIFWQRYPSHPHPPAKNAPLTPKWGLTGSALVHCTSCGSRGWSSRESINSKTQESTNSTFFPPLF